jgi:acyl-CoA synthetase (AMP-forming)/AMP-acid ligase II
LNRLVNNRILGKRWRRGPGLIMLYDLWQQVVVRQGSALALRDLASGRAWTFRELAAEAEVEAPVAGRFAYPQGLGPEFIFTVLRAWRLGQVVCPLETGQLPPLVDDCPTGCIHLKLTSATTGAPRVIAFRPEQLVADVRNITVTMGLRPDWPNLGVISLAHSYGFSNLVLPLLLAGIPLVLCASPLPEAFRRACGGLGTITVAAVPALWQAWHEAGAIGPEIRLAISAGAPLPLALEQAVFDRTGLKIHNFYGASECGGIAYDRLKEPRIDFACVGEPMIDVEVTVAESGCLAVRSQAVGETYWPTPSPQLAAGCFVTSDLGELRRGRVYLLGRASDLINVAGRKVAPETIEQVLRTHPAVRECVVFGVPAGAVAQGETIVALVAGTGDAEAGSLRGFLLERLPAWQVPREWRFLDALPVNERGKLARAEWRQHYLAGRASDQYRSSTS